ncbi:MAG: hypothetical protein AAGB46_18750 [Verrucomicrobiota bacterium]
MYQSNGRTVRLRVEAEGTPAVDMHFVDLASSEQRISLIELGEESVDALVPTPPAGPDTKIEILFFEKVEIIYPLDKTECRCLVMDNEGVSVGQIVKSRGKRGIVRSRDGELVFGNLPSYPRGAISEPTDKCINSAFELTEEVFPKFTDDPWIPID